MTACRSLISALAVATLALQVAAQTPATEGTAGRAAPSKALTDYEGVYEYQSGTKLVVVGAEPLLFAVLDDARYPLRPLGIDTFQNAGGETIPFRRSADGSVSGFVERGVFYARLSPAVDPEIAAAVRARPRPTTGAAPCGAVPTVGIIAIFRQNSKSTTLFNFLLPALDSLPAPVATEWSLFA